MASVFKIVTVPSLIADAAKIESVVAQIVAEVKKISHLASPDSLPLIEYIMNLLHNLVPKNIGADLNKLLGQIIVTLYPQATAEQIASLDETVAYLFKAGKIKKIPVLRYAVHLSNEFLGACASAFFFAK